MENPTFEIRVAHAVVRKGGTHYRARAYVAESFAGKVVKHSGTIALDDCPKEATRLAVDYIRQEYRRGGIDSPANVIDSGRMAGAMVDGLHF